MAGTRDSKTDLKKSRPSSLKISDSTAATETSEEENESLSFQDIKQCCPTCIILLITVVIMVTVIPYAFSNVIKQELVSTSSFFHNSFSDKCKLLMLLKLGERNMDLIMELVIHKTEKELSVICKTLSFKFEKLQFSLLYCLQGFDKEFIFLVFCIYINF